MYDMSLYSELNVSMATVFWQACFYKFGIFLFLLTKLTFMQLFFVSLGLLALSYWFWLVLGHFCVDFWSELFRKSINLVPRAFSSTIFKMAARREKALLPPAILKSGEDPGDEVRKSVNPRWRLFAYHDVIATWCDVIIPCCLPQTNIFRRTIF